MIRIVAPERLRVLLLPVAIGAEPCLAGRAVSSVGVVVLPYRARQSCPPARALGVLGRPRLDLPVVLVIEGVAGGVESHGDLVAQRRA